MTHLNAGAAKAMRTLGVGPEQAVHAATDITGFSLLGHLFQLAKASGVRIQIDSSAIPVLPIAEELALAGNITRGDRENRAYIGEALTVAESVERGKMHVMLDPQTSGGLAICVKESALEALLTELERNGTLERAVIGRVVAAERPGITVTAGD
jgi:selenide,water dikinase